MFTEKHSIGSAECWQFLSDDEWWTSPASPLSLFECSALPEARAALRVIDGLIFREEYRLDAGRFKTLPAVSEWSDFDDFHGLRFAFSAKGAYMFT